jgi:hypothetical protein
LWLPTACRRKRRRGGVAGSAPRGQLPCAADVATMMRLLIAAGVVMGALAVAAPCADAAISGAGLDRPVCGPAMAETVMQNREARLYVRSRGGREWVFGCYRGCRQGRVLGDRSRLRLTRLAGHYAAMVRAVRPAVGERLVIFDLRRGRAGRHVRARRGSHRGVFVRVRLDRTGVAAYTLQRPPGDGLPGTISVAATADGFWPSAPDIDPSVLGLAGMSVAYRQGDTFRIAPFEETNVSDGTLLRLDDLRFTVRRGRLWLHAGPGADRRTVLLGDPISACVSSSGCAGIDALQVAGRFVAVRDRFYDTGESGGEIRVYDLVRHRTRTACRSPGRFGSVGSLVLTDTGLVACVLVDDLADRHAVRAEGVVLDRGPGIDAESLMRRSDRLVWLHDGVERSAPLPTRDDNRRTARPWAPALSSRPRSVRSCRFLTSDDRGNQATSSMAMTVPSRTSTLILLLSQFALRPRPLPSRLTTRMMQPYSIALSRASCSESPTKPRLSNGAPPEEPNIR